MSSGTDFSFDVSKWVEEAKEKAAQFQRDFLRELIEDLVADTPVITGQLRGSWQVSVGTAPVIGGIARLEPGGGFRGSPSPTTTARLTSITEFSVPGETIYFYNIAPYARAVEFGTEQFPGRAYVRGTLARAPAIADSVLGRFG